MVKYVHKRIDKFFNNDDDDGKKMKWNEIRLYCTGWIVRVVYTYMYAWLSVDSTLYHLKYMKRIKSTIEVHYCKLYVWYKGFICSDKNISVLIICLYYLGYKYYVNLSMVTWKSVFFLCDYKMAIMEKSTMIIYEENLNCANDEVNTL